MQYMQDMQELGEIWSIAMSELSKKHSDTFMTIWINDLKLIYLDDSTAHFYIASDFKRSMLVKLHVKVLQEVLENILGYKPEVYISSEAVKCKVSGYERIFELTGGAPDSDYIPKNQVSETKKSPAAEEELPYENPFTERNTTEIKAQAPAEIISDKSEIPEKNDSAEKIEKPSDKETAGIGDPPHWSEYKFENFIVGSSNKFAYAACTAVAKKPAHAYNPLFIYGPSGLGKTHLLYAITNEIQKKNPDFNIIYIKGEEFTNQMIESIGRGTTKKFRERYRKADVLLIDDVHFIAGKDSTQEEFFHTFNDLYEHKKQIILTSDRPAKDIQHLEERLRTRFEWGLTADIQPPDFELRVAIMKNKAELLGKTLSDDVLSLLAEKLTRNIRQMEGAIKKIIAYSYLSGEEITTQMAMFCISDLSTGNDTVKVTPEKIVERVSSKYSVATQDIYTKKRTNEISRARHICIYLLRKISDMSYPKMASLFGRDHATIMSSYKVIEREIKNNSSFEIEINELIKEITG